MPPAEKDDKPREELNYIPEFVLNPYERIIEGSIAIAIILRGLATENYLLAILGAEFLLDATLLKGQGVGQLKWGFSKKGDNK